MDPYHFTDITDRIKKRQEAFDQELNSNSERADLLLITNNVEASVRDIYEFLMGNKERRFDRRKEILKILREKNLLNDNLREDLRLFFEIRDQFAHNMIIDDANREAEKNLEQTSFVKLRANEDPQWENRSTREKIIRVYNALMPELFNQWNTAVIDDATNTE